MKLFLVVVLLCFLQPVSAQNAMGTPEILNYTRQVYGAGTQSWDVKQDQNGILYFANNDGLLSDILLPVPTAS